MTSVAPCRQCGRLRSLDELLMVTDRAEPWRGFYVCRPTLMGPCFRIRVRGAAVHDIAPATRFGPGVPG